MRLSSGSEPLSENPQVQLEDIQEILFLRLKDFDWEQASSPFFQILKSEIKGEMGNRHLLFCIHFGGAKQSELETLLADVSKLAYGYGFEINELKQSCSGDPFPFVQWLLVYE